jgi:flagellum-specific peptidoglycan hydrolase FlgJ
MQNLRNSILFFFLLITFAARSQNSDVILNYINTYKDLAIEEMQRTGVPAAIKLAQGIHETTAGTSDLVLKSNNHFGIKCKDTWTGASVNHDDDARGECFRKYPAALDSYRDHSNFLKGSDRYSFLFRLDPTDYKDWAYGLKRAGYATNPRYPQIIIGLIEDYHLQDYTLIAMGKMNSISGNEIVKTTIENEQKQTGPAFVSGKVEDPVKNRKKTTGENC